ncbi:hypothetical protein [Vineibacter terrae]|uniref:hypothetical protein n=1 Tax=Vineibacter terrae TaxID=2586908 RepID=UPI002E3228E2|nr:hypothetical protein [Vineibacter terrae]HEX2890551.1 hypothetical protein [Vineibacter terrae]
MSRLEAGAPIRTVIDKFHIAATLWDSCPEEPRMEDKARLIADMADALQGIRLTPARAADLAAEVGRLNGAVRGAAADMLRFDDDPAAYAALLARSATS